MVYILSFFLSFKCSLFHNSNVFGSCIIHILYTGRAKIKKIFRRQKVNNSRLAASMRAAHIRKQFENIKKAMFQLTMLILFHCVLKKLFKLS